MTLTRRQLDDVVDEYVGATGNPSHVLHALAVAMMKTVDHVESNWQDRSTARFWERFANRVITLYSALRKAGL